jgi:cytochrome o ubiquinol oxidase subunit 3
MKNLPLTSHELFPDAHHDTYSRTVFGFWVYLMSDFILFGALFATFAVLSSSTFGGPSLGSLFTPSFTLWQTLVLLTSSLTVGLGGASAHRQSKSQTLLFFGATFLLGLIFMGMELKEFFNLIDTGNSWKRSASLSAYFTIVATHGLHVILALLWTLVLLIPVYREGISHVSVRRLTCLRMFWQFINIIWVLIFSFVYLMGVE